jgi:hypothetical protein
MLELATVIKGTGWTVPHDTSTSLFPPISQLDFLEVLVVGDVAAPLREVSSFGIWVRTSCRQSFVAVIQPQFFSQPSHQKICRKQQERAGGRSSSLTALARISTIDQRLAVSTAKP